MELKELLDGLMQELNKVSNSASIIGEPIQLQTSHMVPLLRVTIGFGTGTSDANGARGARDGSLAGGGAGGAMSVEPKAFVVVGPDGIPQMLSMKRGRRAVLQHAVEVPGHAGVEALPAPKAEGK